MTAQSVERNRELYKDYLEMKKNSGKIIDLVVKYRITSSRIHAIVKMMRGIDNSSKREYN